MNILLINHYAGSRRHGMEFRPFYLGRAWARMGHQVTIVAASYSHLRTVAPALLGDRTEERLDGVRYLWLKTPAYRGNGAGRAWNIAVFVGSLLRHGAWLARETRPDAVIASSTYPLDCVPACRIARAARALLFYEVHDLWPLSLIEMGRMSARHPFIRLMQRAEDYACRRSDRVVSVLPLASPHLQQHGMAARKFACVPNGLDAAEWQQNRRPLSAEHRAALDRLKAEGRFLVGYAGAHGLANALPCLLEAAAQMREEPFAFALVGQGPEKPRLQRRAAEQGLARVVFLPPVPREAVPALLDRMDALYIGLQRAPLFRFGISPNKLMDYMMAAKPVVQAIEAGNDMTREAGCGFSVPAEDPAAVAAALRRLRSLPPAAREAMGQRGRRYLLARHEYGTLARHFLSILEETTSEHP